MHSLTLTLFSLQVRKTLQTNFYGLKSMCEQFAPLTQDSGRIVNVSSMACKTHILKSNALKQQFHDQSATPEDIVKLMTKFQVRSLDQLFRCVFIGRSLTPVCTTKERRRCGPLHSRGLARAVLYRVQDGRHGLHSGFCEAAPQLVRQCRLSQLHFYWCVSLYVSAVYLSTADEGYTTQM